MLEIIDQGGDWTPYQKMTDVVLAAANGLLADEMDRILVPGRVKSTHRPVHPPRRPAAARRTGPRSASGSTLPGVAGAKV
jgi:hypothetical protein